MIFDNGFFQSIGLRGVLDLLGVRCTVGSHNLLPPPKETLLSSFTQLHHPSAKLSVGGRALSKHSHRDDSLQWWGKCTGSMLNVSYLTSTKLSKIVNSQQVKRQRINMP